MVERRSKPVASVISPEENQKLHRQKEEAWKTIQAVQERNADKDPDQVLAEVTEEVEAVRQEIYARERQAKQGRR